MRTCVALLLVAVLVGPARAQGGPAIVEAPAAANAPPEHWPRVGGHFGIALPLASFDNDGAAGIGANFVQVGVTPGITVKVSRHWAVDFEFIAFSRWDRKPA